MEQRSRDKPLVLTLHLETIRSTLVAGNSRRLSTRALFGERVLAWLKANISLEHWTAFAEFALGTAKHCKESKAYPKWLDIIVTRDPISGSSKLGISFVS
jgi:hypothetical protein